MASGCATRAGDSVWVLSRGQYLGAGSCGQGVFGSIMSCCVVSGQRSIVCCSPQLRSAEEVWLKQAGNHHRANIFWILLSPVCSILGYYFPPTIKNELLLFGFCVNKMLTATTSIPLIPKQQIKNNKRHEKESMTSAWCWNTVQSKQLSDHFSPPFWDHMLKSKIPAINTAIFLKPLISIKRYIFLVSVSHQYEVSYVLWWLRNGP